MEIKKVLKEDLEKLIPSFKKAFNESEWNQRWTDESVRISLTNIFDFPHFYGLIAIKEGVPVGAILGHIQTSMSMPRDARSLKKLSMKPHTVSQKLTHAS